MTTIVVVQFVKMFFYCFLLVGEYWFLVQDLLIYGSPLPPIRKHLVSPFSFHIGSFESSAASHLGPGGLRIKNSALLDAFQSIQESCNKWV